MGSARYFFTGVALKLKQRVARRIHESVENDDTGVTDACGVHSVAQFCELVGRIGMTVSNSNDASAAGPTVFMYACSSSAS